MPTYTVHVPRELADPLARAEATTFVRDGFSLAAFLFGPLYLLRHKAWLAAALWIAGVAAAGGLCHLVRLPPPAALALLGLAMLFTGLEASSIRRFALARRGLPIAGVVSGRSLEEGERTFFDGETAPPVRPAGGGAAGAGAPRPLRMPVPGVIGLFPDDGM